MYGKLFEFVSLAGLLIGLFVLALLLFDVGKDGLARFLSWEFIADTPSRFPQQGGIRPAIAGSLLLGFLVIVVAVPIGVGAALYLEEYAPKTWWTSRAIAMKPDVLLMDEPCSALDPISTQQVEQLCLELKERYTIIMVTHNMQQATRISDWTAFFNTETDETGKRRGKLVEFSPTKDIFNSPRTKEAKAYISGQFG